MWKTATGTGRLIRAPRLFNGWGSCWSCVKPKRPFLQKGRPPRKDFSGDVPQDFGVCIQIGFNPLGADGTALGGQFLRVNRRPTFNHFPSHFQMTLEPVSVAAHLENLVRVIITA